MQSALLPVISVVYWYALYILKNVPNVLRELYLRRLYLKKIVKL